MGSARGGIDGAQVKQERSEEPHEWEARTWRRHTGEGHGWLVVTLLANARCCVRVLLLLMGAVDALYTVVGLVFGGS